MTSSYIDKQNEWKELYESGLSFSKIAKEEGISRLTVQRVLDGVVTVRSKKKYAHLLNRWVDLYVNQGISSTEIAERDKVDAVTVIKYLKDAGVEMRRQYGQTSPYETFIPTWIELYKAGNSLKEIADQYDTFPQTVHKHLKEHIELRDYEEASIQYSIEHIDDFKRIDTPEKAYWLGVWYATGSVFKNATSVECTLVVASKDRELLERFRKRIGYERSVEDIQQEQKNVSRLRFTQQSFYQLLTKHGLTTDKSQRLQFPLWLKRKLYPSFLMGYYEGKGFCQYRKKENGSFQALLAWYGSEEFLLSVQHILRKETGITPIFRMKWMKKEDGSETVLRSVMLTSKKKIEQIITWLYQDGVACSSKRDMRMILQQQPVETKG